MRLNRPRYRRAAGFSLIEVVVTLVIVALALLGVAKMQAASVSNTQVARLRALISLQAGSLASLMHANPGFWATGLAPASFTMAGTTVTDSSGTLTPSTLPSCVGNTTTCTPTQIAATDVAAWATALNTQIPSYSATVACTTTLPVNCEITLTWVEKYVAINVTTAASVAAMTGTPTYSLFVTP